MKCLGCGRGGALSPCVWCGADLVVPNGEPLELPKAALQRGIAADRLPRAPRIFAADAPIFAACGGGAPRGHLLTVGGARGAGKSTECARAMFGWLKRVKGRGLWLDGEQGPARLGALFRRVEGGSLGRVRCFEVSRWLQAWETIRDEAPAILVVDSLHALTRSDSERRRAARKLLRWARDTRALVLLICRLAKDGTVKGGVDVEYESDASIFVSPEDVWAEKCRWAAEKRVSRAGLQDF